MRRFIAVLTLVTLSFPTVSGAQANDETLADIRQELSVLYVELRKRKLYILEKGINPGRQTHVVIKNAILKKQRKPLNKTRGECLLTARLKNALNRLRPSPDASAAEAAI